MESLNSAAASSCSWTGGGGHLAGVMEDGQRGVEYVHISTVLYSMLLLHVWDPTQSCGFVTESDKCDSEVQCFVVDDELNHGQHV